MTTACPLVKVASSNEVRLDLRGDRTGLYLCTVTAGSRTATNELVPLQ